MTKLTREISLPCLTKRISIQESESGYEFDWQLQNTSIESELLASYQYDSLNTLVEKEYMNRVFASVAEAEAVQDCIESVGGETNHNPQSKVVGKAPVNHPITESTGDIYTTSKHIVRNTENLIDESLYTASVSFDEQVISRASTVNRISNRIESVASRCMNISSVVNATSVEVRDSTENQLEDIVANLVFSIEELQTQVFLLTHAKKELSEVEDGSLTEKVETSLYSIERPTHRLVQFGRQVENWVLCNHGGKPESKAHITAKEF